MLKCQLAVILSALSLIAGCSGDTAATQDDRDQQFEEMMNGVTLVGRSTRLNSDAVHGPERYVINGVSKISGNTWLFQARIQYGGRDLPVPLPVSVKWAGDTPVITLTDASIPGLGSFTARVVLHDGQYAGTWSGEGEDHGGQMFGEIVRNERIPE